MKNLIIIVDSLILTAGVFSCFYFGNPKLINIMVFISWVLAVASVLTLFVSLDTLKEISLKTEYNFMFYVASVISYLAVVSQIGIYVYNEHTFLAVVMTIGLFVSSANQSIVRDFQNGEN